MNTNDEDDDDGDNNDNNRTCFSAITGEDSRLASSVIILSSCPEIH